MVSLVAVARRFWPALSGPLLTAGVLALIALVDHYVLPVRQPALLVLPAVACAAWVGLRAGLVSAGLVLLYAGATLATPGRPLTYAPDNALTLVVLLLLAPLLAVLVSRWRRGLRRLAAAQAAQETWTRTALAHLEEGVVTFDNTGRIEACNPAVEHLFGYTPAELVGQRLETLLPGVPLPAAGAVPPPDGPLLRRSLTGRRGDGSTFPLELEVQAVYSAAARRFIGIVRDLTERQKAEAALQQVGAQVMDWVQELEQHTREITMLSELGDLLQSCLTAEEAYATITQFAPRLFPDAAGAVCVLSSSRNLVEVVAHWGGAPVCEPVFGLEDCWALRRGRVHLVEDAGTDLVCHHLGSAPPAGYLCVPMLAQGEILGLLHLQLLADGSAARGRLEARRRLAGTMVEHIAMALANLRLRESLRNQAIRDPLTGLFNRRYMEESLEREMRRAARNQASVGLIMLDIDHFKRFNDTFGHTAGDSLLRELGAFLRTFVREEDIACRYGGEEFILVMPDAGLANTRKRAEQLRDAARHLGAEVRGQALGGITLSLGVSCFPTHGITSEALLQAADAALYRAKAAGRDRVVVGTVREGRAAGAPR